MKLPNAEKALVERKKLTSYLLNASHPDNGGKAAFFELLGFHQENWNELRFALLDLARDADIVKSVASPHGMKYIVDGPVMGPSERQASVRSVWIRDTGEQFVRLVTAYPHDE